ncbi:MAG: OB-fold domain-containing protein [Emcibacter sp.]|nr:OB-fold domain-containing protein [Emcibacter sp.]
MSVQNTIPLVYDNILTSGPDFHLQGGYCPDCDRYYFPIKESCMECLGSVDKADLGKRGIVYSVTTIRTRPPLGLPQPYSVAYVDLENVPLRVFSLMDPSEAGQYCIGQTVELKVAPLGLNNNKQVCLRPYFRSISSPQETDRMS